MDEKIEEIRDALLRAIDATPDDHMTICFECVSELQDLTKSVIAETQIQELLRQRDLEINLTVVKRSEINGTIGINTLTLGLILASSLISRETLRDTREILIELIAQAEYMFLSRPAEAHQLLNSYRPLKVSSADLILAELREKWEII